MSAISSILKADHNPAWKWSLKIWLVARICLSAWAALIWKFGLINYEVGRQYYLGVPRITNGLMGALVGVWQRWDALYYMRIAQFGYNSEELSIYFPLYPLLGRFFSLFFGGNILLGLLVVSNLAFLLSLVVFYSISEYEYSSSLARRVLLTIILFPISFYFLAPYPQSLALLLVLLAYWAARQNKWGWATLAGLAAGLTHSTVLPLTLALAWETWQGWKEVSFRQGLLHLAASLAPMLGMGCFLAWRALAGFAPFQEVGYEYWGRLIQWPWLTTMDIIQLIRTNQLPAISWINMGIIYLVIICALITIKVINWNQRIYLVSFLGYLFLVTTVKEPYASFGRYSLLIFPLYIGLAHWQSTRIRRNIIAIVGLSLQLFFSGLFVMWGWVN